MLDVDQAGADSLPDVGGDDADFLRYLADPSSCCSSLRSALGSFFAACLAFLDLWPLSVWNQGHLSSSSIKSKDSKLLGDLGDL